MYGFLDPESRIQSDNSQKLITSSLYPKDLSRTSTNTELHLAKETSMDSHVLRHDGLLHEITEGRMRGKPTRGRRIQMLHDFANDGGYVALKWATEDREGWRHTERMSKTCSTAVYY